MFLNTEFYFAPKENISTDKIILTDEEVKHLVKVMRHKVGDKIYVTDGLGKIFLSEIVQINKNDLVCKILETTTQQNQFANIIFWIPILKTSDRLEFAIEKCVELGITNFAIYDANKSHKRGIKVSRLEKIAMAAMKQSLRSFLPKITISELSNIDDELIIVLEQNSENSLAAFLHNNSTTDLNKKYNFIFGPEAGLTETDLVNLKDTEQYQLTSNRLRAETAIVTTAALISTIK